jgi:hypothetical protein
VKKIVILFLAISLAGTTITAMEGLSVGGELAIVDFDDAGEWMFIRPMVIYEKSFDALDIYVEGGAPFWVNPEFWLGLDVNAKVTYNLDVGLGKLALSAESWSFLPVIEDFMISTVSQVPVSWFGVFGGSYKFSTYLGLEAQYTHGFDFGDFYGRVETPFVVIENGASFFDWAMLNLTAGVEANSGFGGGMTIFNVLRNYGDGSDFFYAVGLFGSYRSGPLFAGIDIVIPVNDMDFYGVTFVPKIEYKLDSSFTIYGSLPISGIGSDNDVILGLIAGVKYRF